MRPHPGDTEPLPPSSSPPPSPFAPTATSRALWLGGGGAEQLGEYYAAIADTGRAIKLEADNIPALEVCASAASRSSGGGGPSARMHPPDYPHTMHVAGSLSVSGHPGSKCGHTQPLRGHANSSTYPIAVVARWTYARGTCPHSPGRALTRPRRLSPRACSCAASPIID